MIKNLWLNNAKITIKIKDKNDLFLSYVYLDENKNEYEEYDDYLKSLIKNEKDAIKLITLTNLFKLIQYIYQDEKLFEKFKEMLDDKTFNDETDIDIRKLFCINDKYIDIFQEIENDVNKISNLNSLYLSGAKNYSKQNKYKVPNKPISKKTINVLQGYFSKKGKEKKK